MPEQPCWDPLEVPCGWGGSDGFHLVRLNPGESLPCGVVPPCLVSLAQTCAWPELPAEVALEVRCSEPAAFQPHSPGRPWNLFLEYVQAGKNDDLGLLEEVLEKAAWAGCASVVAVGLEGAPSYRYRWFSLVRLLCDRLRLRFSIWEQHQRSEDDKLNRYLANQKGCCRLPGYRPPRRARPEPTTL